MMADLTAARRHECEAGVGAACDVTGETGELLVAIVGKGIDRSWEPGVGSRSRAWWVCVALAFPFWFRVLDQRDTPQGARRVERLWRMDSAATAGFHRRVAPGAVARIHLRSVREVAQRALLRNPAVRGAGMERFVASAGCHADWRDEPFHTGAPHRGVAQQCTLCHLPHAAKVDASDCAGCHAAVKARSRGRVHPPQAFDTTRALRRVSLIQNPEPEGKGKGDANPPRAAPAPDSWLPAPVDSFPHDRHKQLACLTCHVTRRTNASLTFVPPRGCQICHHQAPATTACSSCHASGELASPHAESIAIAVDDHPARARTVTFAHATHAQIRCTTCHEAAVTLEPAPPIKTCTACHEDHHSARRDCAGCHSGVDIRAAHADSVDAHVSCDACHREATVARLVPDRGLCLTCHAPQREHYAPRECTTCHFLETPEAYRTHLRKAGA